MISHLFKTKKSVTTKSASSKPHSVQPFIAITFKTLFYDSLIDHFFKSGGLNYKAHRAPYGRWAIICPCLHQRFKGICDWSRRGKKHENMQLPAIVSMNASFSNHQPHLSHPGGGAASFLFVTSCLGDPLLLDHLGTKAAGSEGLPEQEVARFFFFLHSQER